MRHKNINRHTIKRIMLIFSGALILSVLIVQVLFNLLFAKSLFYAQQKSDIQDLYNDIKKNYKEDIQKIRDITAEAEELKNIKIIIMQGDKIVYNSRNPAMKTHNIITPEMMENGFSENPKAVVENISQTDGNGKMLRLLGMFKYNGSYVHVMIFNYVESIDNSLNLFTKSSFIVSVIVLAGGLAVAYIFAVRISKPVKSMQEVAGNIAELNFNKKVENKTSIYEIVSLSESINSMSDTLEKTITDLKYANEKLLRDIDIKTQSENMRKEFIANISHEMKTPLSLLMMYSETLKHNGDVVDKDFYLDTIVEESARLDDMVKSLLDISAVENGLTKMNKQRTDVSELTFEVCEKMKVLLTDFDYSNSIEENIVTDVDPKYIDQAMKNYITNAICHTQKGNRITITLEKQDRNAVFTVYNEGATIDDDQMECIWQSFYKTDKSRKRDKENHLGLGWYIVSTIIEKHNGTYYAENMSDGVKFVFTIPII